jgi:hypothetical protein
METIVFALSEGDDRLWIVGPPELAGTGGISHTQVTSSAELERAVGRAFEEQLFQLQRRSSELQTLSLSPRVDPQTLELSAEVEASPYTFRLVADRRGRFHVGAARREGQELPTPPSASFELSEFREPAALTAYLAALFEEAPRTAPFPSGQSQGWVTFGEVAQHFGSAAMLPPRSALEVLLEVRVGTKAFRFAAVRVVGRTFRGLLAGPSGKLWSGRFELGEFRGVASLVSEVLGVPEEAVEVSSTPGTDSGLGS